MRYVSSAAALVFSIAPSYTVRSTAVSASSAFVTNGSARPLATSSTSLGASKSDNVSGTMADQTYPGTAVQRMTAVRERVLEVAAAQGFNGEWVDVRRKILWAGGLRDLPNAVPGQGYTGHSFNDFNHVDLTCMNDGVSDNENDGAVRGIAVGNRLGPGIRAASLEELGPGGSWSTCANGCHLEPPQDVAHIQFRSRIAFKLVWAPTPGFDEFVLVDDEGKLLANGKPTGALPSLRERQMNYRLVQGSKYAVEADNIAKGVASA